MRLEPVLEGADDTQPVAGEIDGGSRAIHPQGQPSRRVDRHGLIAAFQLPVHHGTAGEAQPDAVVIQKVGGLLRLPPRRQIGRRSGQGDTLDAGADRHGDDVLGQVFTIADARVAAGGSDVDQPILDDDLDPHVGMTAHEAFDQVRKDVDHDRAGHVQPEQAAHLRTRARRVLKRRPGFVQQRSDAARQQGPRLGDADASGRAEQEGNAQPAFQLDDLFADGRGRQVQPLGRRPETARLGHGQEDAEIVQPIQAIIVRHAEQTSRSYRDYQT